MTPDTYTRQDFSKAIRGLSKNQRDVMSAVAFGDDGGHHPKTLEALEKRGLIKHTTQQLGGRFPVTISSRSIPCLRLPPPSPNRRNGDDSNGSPTQHDNGRVVYAA